MLSLKKGIIAAAAYLSLMLLPAIANHQTGSGEPMSTAHQSGPLDGKVFVGKLGPEGKVKDIADVFVFENGTFVSKECELRCDYPARPYFIRELQGKTEFLSHTKCPYKDAEIVWHGTVDGNRISGTATWTLKRWYWTVVNRYDFEGELEDAPPPQVSSRQ